MGFIGKTNSSLANKATPFSMADALPVQTKLSVSKAADPAEKEADSVARKVADDQKDKKANAKKGEEKKDMAATAPMTEPTPDPKKEGVKTKEDKDKKDVQKMGGEKEEKKAAKKDDDKKDKAAKKDDKKQEAQKKNEEKEEKKAAKKDDDKKDKAAKKDDKKQEAEKKSEEKEEKKAAKKDDDKKDKVAKKDDKKQEAQKKSEEKEEKKAAKKEDNGKDKKPVDKEKETNAKPKSIHRKESSGKEDKPAIQQKPKDPAPATALGRKEGGNSKEPAQQDDPENDEAKLQAIEQKINAKKGSGRPMNDQVKSDMEQSFKFDFSEVKIHTDKESAELCAALNAQAFAIGNDIFFNTGKYDPESDQGRELLAHELTHVVQQKDEVQRAVAYRNPAPSGGGGGAADGTVAAGLITINSPELSLPKTKEKHAPTKYAGSVKTKMKYNREEATAGTDAQDKLWKDTVQPTVSTKVNELVAKVTTPQNPKATDVYYFENSDKTVSLFGKKETILENSKIPLWNKNGRVTAYDVDHIKELQLEGGENEPGNLELLNFSANRGSGSTIARATKDLLAQFLKTDTAKKDPLLKSGSGVKGIDTVMDEFVIEYKTKNFNKVTGTTPKAEDRWSMDQIQAGEHLSIFAPMGSGSLEKLTGESAEPTAFTSPAGGASIVNSTARMPGFNAKVTINPGAESAPADAEVGQLGGTLSVNDRILRPMSISIPLYKMEGLGKAGYIARRGDGKQNLEGILRRLNFLGLSPIEIHFVDILPGKGIMASGQIKPSVEMIKDLYIDFTIEGDKIELSRTFSSGEIKSIPPPLKVNDASITVFAGTGGIGVRGNIDFEINKVGKGTITGSGNSDGVFKLNGNFDFDEKLFGGVKANVKASYEHVEGGEDKWDVNGNIKIPKGKIKGIDSAEINVNYADRIFKADGSAKFGIPGLEDGKMSVTYGNDQLLIQGEANFKHKFIKSGKVTAKVETAGDETKVSMSGNAKPNIPGIDTDLTVSYVDGVFTVSGTVGYTKGRLSGTATVGVTNQAVGADGKPSGGPGDDLKVFGGGSLTLKITDWLQGTAGVTFKPDGNIEVVGKIGIPAAVNIFEKKEIKKEIFKAPTIEIPLFAIPVGSRSIGLVATIGGGAEAYASIGPGQLTEAAVEVKYNPADESTLAISGNAKFKVPAEAGLRLYVRAGIGLSIGIARIAGGIELGGAIGIEGAAEAGVAVNWTPAQGFKLDAEASLSVQPKFKFDINAYVEAVLDLWVTEFRKEWKWNLYAFEWGPSMKFGVKFPVHYEENKPFEISLDDVQFEAPDINVGDFAKGVGQQLFG
jgi:hypothetical protein